MSVDPLASKYPSMSPYNYCGNNPISNIDMKGDSITPINGVAFNVNRDRGTQAGEYTVHPGSMENKAGETIPISVASKINDNGTYEDQWIIHTGQGYSKFMKNHSMFSRISRIPGLGKGYGSLWSPESILVGITMTGATLSSTTFRLQGYVNKAVREVDKLGYAALTPKQAAAALRNPKLYPMYRGNRIDVMTRKFVKQDKFLSSLKSNYTRGADFTRGSRWWDITTQAAWKAHVKKYGPGGTLLRTN